MSLSLRESAGEGYLAEEGEKARADSDSRVPPRYSPLGGTLGSITTSSSEDILGSTLQLGEGDNLDEFEQRSRGSSIGNSRGGSQVSDVNKDSEMIISGDRRIQENFNERENYSEEEEEEEESSEECFSNESHTIIEPEGAPEERIQESGEKEDKDNNKKTESKDTRGRLEFMQSKKGFYKKKKDSFMSARLWQRVDEWDSLTDEQIRDLVRVNFGEAELETASTREVGQHIYSVRCVKCVNIYLYIYIYICVCVCVCMCICVSVSL